MEWLRASYSDDLETPRRAQQKYITVPRESPAVGRRQLGDATRVLHTTASDVETTDTRYA